MRVSCFQAYARILGVCKTQLATRLLHRSCGQLLSPFLAAAALRIADRPHMHEGKDKGQGAGLEETTEFPPVRCNLKQFGQK